MGKSIARTTERQKAVCIMCGDKVPIDTARQHLVINYPDVATLLEDCEKAEELRQTRLEMLELVRGVAQKTGKKVELPVENNLTDNKTSPVQIKPAIKSQDLERAEVQVAAYLKMDPMSGNEIDRELSPQITIDRQKVRPITDKDYLLPVENLRQICSLNRVERAFCAGLVLWLGKLPPEERRKETQKLAKEEPKQRAMLGLYLVDEIRGEMEHKKAEETQEKMRDQNRDVIIIGRKFVKAVI